MATRTPPRAHRDECLERIGRAQAWLAGHGHVVTYRPVEDLDSFALIELLDSEERRVRVLADEWRTWT